MIVSDSFVKSQKARDVEFVTNKSKIYMRYKYSHDSDSYSLNNFAKTGACQFFVLKL